MSREGNRAGAGSKAQGVAEGAWGLSLDKRRFTGDLLTLYSSKRRVQPGGNRALVPGNHQ